MSVTREGAGGEFGSGGQGLAEPVFANLILSPLPSPLFFGTECASDRKERRWANARTEKYCTVRGSGRSVSCYTEEKGAHVAVRTVKGRGGHGTTKPREEVKAGGRQHVETLILSAGLVCTIHYYFIVVNTKTRRLRRGASATKNQESGFVDRFGPSTAR